MKTVYRRAGIGVGALLLVLISGCASLDQGNSSSRAWGGPSDRELRENWWRVSGWSFYTPYVFPSQVYEQQLNEELHNPSQWR